MEKTSDKLNEIKFKNNQPSRELFYRNEANLLLANINSLEKGMSEIQIEDIYNESAIKIINLDKKLTPAENINHYFDKAKKKWES